MDDSGKILDAISRTQTMLERLFSDKGEYSTHIALMNAKLTSLEEKVMSLERSLRGNGNHGLSERVSLVEQKLKIAEKDKVSKMGINAAIITGVAGFLTAVANTVLSMVGP